MTQAPSDKPMRQLLAAADEAVESDGKLAAQLKGITRDLNTRAQATSMPKHHNEGLPHFVQLSRQLGEALIEVATQQVTRAENNLHEVQQWSENMQNEAQRKWEEMQEMERKFEDYRSYVLQANDRFNGGGKK